MNFEYTLTAINGADPKPAYDNPPKSLPVAEVSLPRLVCILYSLL
jgi:hypothetical protein